MEPHIKLLQSSASSRLYRKGANLLFQGEVPRSGLLIEHGIVRAYTIASSGEERTIAFYTRGDITPLSWLLDQTSNVLFYYEALSDVRVQLIEKKQFQALITTDAEASHSLLTSLSRDYSTALLHINGLEQSRAEEKIAYILYVLLFRYGSQTTEDTYIVDLGLRHHVIASMVGLSRESTTKVLRLFQRKQMVSYDKGVYTIKKSLLEHFLGEDAFRDLKLR